MPQDVIREWKDPLKIEDGVSLQKPSGSLYTKCIMSGLGLHCAQLPHTHTLSINIYIYIYICYIYIYICVYIL